MGRNVRANDMTYYETQRYREESSQFQASTALLSDKERRNIDGISSNWRRSKNERSWVQLDRER